MASFSDLPVDLALEIMKHLDLESLQNLITVNKGLCYTFLGAKANILPRVLSNEVGASNTPFAILRYAASVPSLRAGIDIEVSGPPSAVALSAGPDGATRFLDPDRFRPPPCLFTLRAIRAMVSFHKALDGELREFNVQRLRVSNIPLDRQYIWLTGYTNEQASLYLAETAHLLFPHHQGRHASFQLQARLIEGKSLTYGFVPWWSDSVLSYMLSR
ncbi:hypothetical protein GGR56DRAFT_673748 [Xylariaceae sp. FL0804]|nr:hypothetical protein GGR56DRAFT_673748 [Xylariaceae sp. FL0804]